MVAGASASPMAVTDSIPASVHSPLHAARRARGGLPTSSDVTSTTASAAISSVHLVNTHDAVTDADQANDQRSIQRSPSVSQFDAIFSGSASLSEVAKT